MKRFAALVLLTLAGCGEELVSDEGRLGEIAAIGDVLYLRFDTECSRNYYCDEATDLVGSLADEIGPGQLVRVWYPYDPRPEPAICCTSISEHCGVRRAVKIEVVDEP